MSGASVRHREGKSGAESWAVLFRLGDKQSSKTFETESGAEDFAALVKRFGATRALRYLEDEQPRVTTSLTVGQLATKWLKDKQPEVTERIYRGYKRDVRIWLKPLEDYEAALVDETDVQKWVDWMKVTTSKTTGKPLAAKSIADKHAILHQIFAWGSAKTRQLVPYNPCKETSLPTRHKKAPKGLRIPELHALLAAGAKVDADAADLIAFMAGTGWRISEAIAVPVGAVEDKGADQDGKDLGVYVTMQQVRRRHVGIVEDAKSDAGLGRRLRVLGPGADALRTRVTGKAQTELVFTFHDGRPGVKKVKPWNENSFRGIRWPRVVAAAGLTERHPTPHWLRHTHVALCIAAGLSLPEIQRRLGHEDIQTTINVYGRMLDEMSEESAEMLDKLLRPSMPEVVEATVIPSMTMEIC